MAINATDNEALATELWGENKYWDEDRQQYLPNRVKVGEDVSAGDKSKALSSETEKSDENNPSNPLTNAPTTEPPFKLEKGDTTAHSTDGNGPAKP